MDDGLGEAQRSPKENLSYSFSLMKRIIHIFEKVMRKKLSECDIIVSEERQNHGPH